jgi:hypothetical protein
MILINRNILMTNEHEQVIIILVSEGKEIRFSGLSDQYEKKRPEFNVLKGSLYDLYASANPEYGSAYPEYSFAIRNHNKSAIRNHDKVDEHYRISYLNSFLLFNLSMNCEKEKSDKTLWINMFFSVLIERYICD